MINDGAEHRVQEQARGDPRRTVDALDSMCDFIRGEAADRRRREQPVTLDHFLERVPGIVGDPVLADTAIRAVLDAAVAKGRNRAAAAAELRREHPELAEAIGLALILDNAFGSTGAFMRIAGVDFAPRLPADFGPPWRGGEHRFSLTDRIASGAHGVVFRAFDRALSTDGRTAWAAIKVLNAADSGAELARREAIRARAIDHPSVARVLTAGETDEGQSFIAFEFVEGTPLRLWRADHAGPIGADAAVRLIVRIAEGLAAAHAVGVTHADLHPGNILITSSGAPKIVDFGLGNFSMGVVIGGKSRGALGFMPPECWLGTELDPVLADVFGVGALLHWLILGAPANGSTVEEAEQHLAGGGRSPGDIARSATGSEVDHDLAWILGRALAGDPSERYQSAASFLADLERWQHHEPLHWTKPNLWHRTRLAVRRAPVTVAVCLLAAVLGVGGAAASTAIALRGRIAVAEQASIAAEQELKVLRVEAERARAARQIASGLMNLMNTAPTGTPEPRWLLLLSLLEDLMRVEGGTAALVEKRLERQVQAARYFREEVARLEGECSMATLTWDAALGRWLLDAGRWKEAHETLGPAVERSRAHHPGDPMGERLALMADVAIVFGADGTDMQKPALLRARDRLMRADRSDLPASVRARIDSPK